MTDPAPPRVSAPSEIPGQRSPYDHPMSPGLATPYVGGTYAPASTLQTANDEAYAHWGLRVAAAVIDSLLQIPFLIAEVVGIVTAFDGGGLSSTEQPGTGLRTFTISVDQMTTGTWVGLALVSVASLTGSSFTIWNTIVRQGRQGASIGKQCMNLMVVSDSDGRPIGVVLTWIRGWAHVLDLVPLGLGYLWPLWDSKRQTFADMAMKTAVLHLPPLPPAAPRIPEQPTRPYRW